MIVSINGVWCSDARIAENTVPEAVSRIHPLSANTSPDRSIYGWIGCGITLCASSSHCCVCARQRAGVIASILRNKLADGGKAEPFHQSHRFLHIRLCAIDGKFRLGPRGRASAAENAAEAEELPQGPRRPAAASHQLRIRFISALLSEGMTRAFPRRPRSQNAGSTHGPRRSSGTASGRGPRRPPLWRAIYPPYKTDR